MSVASLKRLGIVAVAGALLASCMEAPSTPTGPTPVNLSGATLSASAASEIFQQVCIAQSPRFGGAGDAATSLGFVLTGDTGRYLDSRRNALIEISASNEPTFSDCRILFVAASSDASYQGALLGLPRVARSERPRMRDHPVLFVDGNGQKHVTFAGFSELSRTKLRMYRMLVGASAEQYD